LTAEEYENILNHVNSYVQQLVELKMQQQLKDLPPQQVQLIVQLMKENLQQFAEKTQLTEKDLADLAIKLKLELQQSDDWQDAPKSLSEYTFTLPELPKINVSDYLNQAQYESLRSQAAEHAVRVRDWADDYVLYLRTIGQNVVNKGRQIFQADDEVYYERV